MQPKVKPITPRCGICKRLYSARDDDGSGLCLKCRPATSQPILSVRRQLKKTIVMEVGKMLDDFDQDVLQEQTTGSSYAGQEDQIVVTEQVTPEAGSNELKIEEIIENGRYGVTNSQMIPALKKAIAEKSVEKVALLKKAYLYPYNKSVRYLKKAEREFIASNDI